MSQSDDQSPEQQSQEQQPPEQQADKPALEELNPAHLPPNQRPKPKHVPRKQPKVILSDDELKREEKKSTIGVYKLLRVLASVIVPIIVTLVVVIFLYAVGQDVNFESPEETAPFAEAIDYSDGRNLNLGKPHRTQRDLEEWITKVILEAYHLNKDNYSDQLQTIKPYFNDVGYQEFVSYLQQAKIDQVVQEGTVQASAVIDGVPDLVTEGSLSDRYRWLFEIPAVVGYAPLSVSKYQKNVNHQSKKITIRLQVGRAGTPKDPDLILIETWAVKPRR